MCTYIYIYIHIIYVLWRAEAVTEGLKGLGLKDLKCQEFRTQVC